MGIPWRFSGNLQWKDISSIGHEYLPDGLWICYTEYAKSSILLHISKYLKTVEPLHKYATNCSSDVC